jgi:hypothetical protein
MFEANMTAADISNLNLGDEGAIIIAAWISHTAGKGRSISHLNILKNSIGEAGQRAIEAAFEASHTLKSICGATGPELDLSGQELGAVDANIIALELAYNTQLSVVNVLKNDLPQAQIVELIEIMRRKSNLKSLCGIHPGQQAADFSGQKGQRKLKAVDAFLIANDLIYRGFTLLNLNLSNNRLNRGKAIFSTSSDMNVDGHWEWDVSGNSM